MGTNEQGDILTTKQRAFADAIIAGKSAAQAYREAYGSKASDKTISSEAAKLRKHPGISAYIATGLASVANDSGITHESHAAELIRTRDDARKKGDHATVLRAQEALAAFVKLRDEPGSVSGVEAYKASEGRHWSNALKILSYDELCALEHLMENLEPEMERLRAGGEPVTDKERQAMRREGRKTLEAIEDATVAVTHDGEPCSACGLRPLDPHADTALKTWLMRAGRDPDVTGLTPSIERALRSAAKTAESWKDVKGNKNAGY